jgi:hypothetical protein
MECIDIFQGPKKTFWEALFEIAKQALDKLQLLAQTPSFFFYYGPF